MFSIPCWPLVYLLLSVQGFAHLKNLCFHHFVIELSEFLTYSGYKVFVRYRYCKYVLPVCVLSCHFNDHRFRILMKSNSSGFSFLWFCGFCKKSLQVIKKFSYAFFRSFAGLGSLLRSVVHLHCVWCEIHMFPQQLLKHHLLKTWLSPLNRLMSVSKFRWPYICGSISRLGFVPLIYLSYVNATLS